MSLFDFLLHHSGLYIPAQWEPSRTWLSVVAFIAMLVATSIHMYGHALMADFLGDKTPRTQGRLSFSPLAHLDPLGLLLLIVTSLIGFPIGWGGRPLRTNPENFRCGAKRGMGLVAVAGPIANLLFACALSPIARWILHGGLGFDDFAIQTLLVVCLLMIISLSLFAFNFFVPVAPLDGCQIVASLLPEAISKPFRTFMSRYGSYVLIALMYTEVLGKLIAPIIIYLFLWLIGLR